MSYIASYLDIGKYSSAISINMNVIGDIRLSEKNIRVGLYVCYVCFFPFKSEFKELWYF